MLWPQNEQAHQFVELDKFIHTLLQYTKRWCQLVANFI